MLRRLLQRRKQKLDTVLAMIDSCDDHEISQIIQAIIRRYSRVFPDWEVVFLSLPRDPSERARQVDGVIRMLQKERTE